MSEKAARERMVQMERKAKQNNEQAIARLDYWKLKLVPADFELFFNGFKIMAHNWQELPEIH